MLQNQLREEAEAFKANRVDFDDFELYGIQKNSRVDKLLAQLRKKAITPEELKWLDSVGFSTELELSFIYQWFPSKSERFDIAANRQG